MLHRKIESQIINYLQNDSNKIMIIDGTIKRFKTEEEIKSYLEA